jgi:predicted Fe-Mo cluster-binding NifX family protein/outer membrane lipoprotein-sorting protein
MRKTGLSILILALLGTQLVYAADKGRTAIAAEGNTVTAAVSEAAARSPHFLIFDGDGKLLETLDNPHKTAERGAGSLVASFLAQTGATFVVAEKFGEKMSDAMRAKGIGYLEFQGSVKAALEKRLETITVPVPPAEGDDILAQVDRNLAPASYEMYRKLVNEEPDGRKKEFILFTVKKGRDKMAGLFISPASDKGRATLRLGDNMWLYIPNVGKPVRITSLQSVVGGVFNNSDILQLDYTEEYSVSRVEDHEKESLLYLKAKTRNVAYDQLRMWVDKENILPTKIECLTEASMLIKTLYFKDIKDFGGGIVRPAVMETDSPLYKGYRSYMIYAKIEAREIPDEVFTVNFMSRIESLR